MSAKHAACPMHLLEHTYYRESPGALLPGQQQCILFLPQYAATSCRQSDDGIPSNHLCAGIAEMSNHCYVVHRQEFDRFFQICCVYTAACDERRENHVVFSTLVKQEQACHLTCKTPGEYCISRCCISHHFGQDQAALCQPVWCRSYKIAKVGHDQKKKPPLWV